jgi:hypothetical protein
MRYTVRRVSPWSAVRIGAIIGIFQGLLVGALLAAMAGAIMPYADVFLRSIGWTAVLLMALFGGVSWALIFVVGALVYNVAGCLGAALEIELEPSDEIRTIVSTKQSEKPDGSDKARKPDDPLLGESLFGTP